MQHLIRLYGIFLSAAINPTDIMKSNPNGFAEPTIIGTETEAKDYVLRQETNEVSKRKLLPIHIRARSELEEVSFWELH